MPILVAVNTNTTILKAKEEPETVLRGAWVSRIKVELLAKGEKGYTDGRPN